MSKSPFLIALACVALGGCTGNQVKSTVEGTDNAVTLSMLETDADVRVYDVEFERTREFCQAVLGDVGPVHCASAQQRMRRRLQGKRERDERAANERAAIRAQRARFDAIFDASASDDCDAADRTCEQQAPEPLQQHKAHNQILDSLAEDLSNTLTKSDP